MKNLLLALLLCGCLFLVVPFATEAAGLVPCGGSGEQPCQSCDVVKLANNVIGWLVLILGTVAALVIVYAGVKLVTAGGNRSAREEAKGMMTNILIGYLIVLSGWLVIDYILKALLDDASFGVWNEVQCVEQRVPQETEPMILEWSNPAGDLSGLNGWGNTGSSGTTQASCGFVSGPAGSPTNQYDCSAQIAQCTSVAGVPSISAAGDTVICAPGVRGSVDTSGLGQCSSSNSACSVSALQAAGLNSEQANIMSCIAMTESSGDPSTPPYNVTNPNARPISTACGTFQITQTTWNTAAGGACSSFSNCQNGSCNLATAVTLVQRNRYSDWTCPNCNNKAAGCVVKYEGY